MKPNILITGDVHGTIDPRFRFIKYQHKNMNLTKDDYLIVTGDMGVCWYGNNEDKSFQKQLENICPATILFCDGNHENFHLLNSYPIEEWNGGKIHRISNTIIHLIRGQVYDINGITFFVMGGAVSQDKMYRTKDVSWWEEEMPSLAEYNEAESNLKKYNYNVDYVITHCCSSRTQYRINPTFSRDALTDWFNDIEAQLEFKHWYFGHYHFDDDIDDRHTCLYTNVITLGANAQND